MLAVIFEHRISAPGQFWGNCVFIRIHDRQEILPS